MTNTNFKFEPAYLSVKASLIASLVVTPILVTSIVPAIAGPQAPASTGHEVLSYKASRLVLEDVQQDIELSVARQKEVMFESAPVEGYVVSLENDTLIVRGTGSHSYSKSLSGVTVIAVNGAAHLSIPAAGIAAKESRTDPLKITVPVDTEVTVTGHNGSVSAVGPYRAVNYQGRGKLNIDYVEDADLDIAGNARVRIEEIRGDLYVNGSGNSRLSLKHGRIESAIITQKGNSKIRFPGVAEHLHLTAKGNSSFKVGDAIYIEKLDLVGNAKAKFQNEKKSISVRSR